MSRLYLVRGLPGSGKSTYAKTFGCYHVETDMFFNRNGFYKWDSVYLKTAHKWCFDLVRDAVEANIDVVVSNTFTTKKEWAPYLGFDIQPEVYRMTTLYKNTHEVPQETIDRMAARFQDFKGEILV